MSELRRDVALRELCRLVTSSSFRRGGPLCEEEPKYVYDVDLVVRAGIIQVMTLSWPEIDWSATCDASGVEIRTGGETLKLDWADAPRVIKPPKGGAHTAKYDPRLDVMDFPLTENGPWSRIRCPALFGLWLWNAVLWGWPKAEGA